MYAFAVECLPERKYNKAEILKEYGGSSMQTVLEAKGLKKYYGKEPNVTKALDGVSMEVKQGEFVSIIGTSGAGWAGRPDGGKRCCSGKSAASDE